MGALQRSMQVYKRQLAQGDLQTAYRGLMAFMRELRGHFQKEYARFTISSLYYGFMDMTYFALTTKELARRKLKVAVVFVHEEFRFEVWLSGANRDVQGRLWRVLREEGWQGSRLAQDPRREDFVAARVLVAEPDFNDLDALRAGLVKGVLAFCEEAEEKLVGLEG